MRAFAFSSLLALAVVFTLACDEVRPLVDKGGDNGEGTSDIAASATGTSGSTTGTGTGTGTGGAGGMSSSSSASSTSSGAGGGMGDAGAD